MGREVDGEQQGIGFDLRLTEMYLVTKEWHLQLSDDVQVDLVRSLSLLSDRLDGAVLTGWSGCSGTGISTWWAGGKRACRGSDADDGAAGRGVAWLAIELPLWPMLICSL